MIKEGQQRDENEAAVASWGDEECDGSSSACRLPSHPGSTPHRSQRHFTLLLMSYAKEKRVERDDAVNRHGTEAKGVRW